MTRSDVLTIAVTLLAVAVTFLVSPSWGWAFVAGGFVVLGIYFVMGRGSKPWPTAAVVGVPVCALILVCCFLVWKVFRPQPKQDAPVKTAVISPQAPAAEPLSDQPPTSAPHTKSAAKHHPVQTESAPKVTAAKATPATPPAQAPGPTVINNSPNGIANSGTIQQATVNNFGSSSNRPTVLSVSLIQPVEPAIVVENLSDNVANEVTWEFVAFRTADLTFFTFPTRPLGFIKAHGKNTPNALQLDILPYPRTPGASGLNNGDNLVGTLLVDCPTCRGNTLIVNLVWRSGGWFYDDPDSHGLLVPKDMTANSIRGYLEYLNTVKAEDRKVIH
jgi:hypothetical protein